MKYRPGGFTLLEILLVVAAIGILAAIVIVAINPNEQLAKVRDSERQSEVSTLYDAIQQYNIDNGGQWPDAIENMSTNSAEEICADGKTGGGCIDLTDDLDPTYLAEVPSDPQAEESGNGSGYVVSKQDKRIRISAPNVEERSEVITAGYASDYVLDENPFAAAAYSVRRLRAGYTGPAMTVRKSTGNTTDPTQDIGFNDEGALDAQELNNFCGTSNCYVQAWHDQSGNNRDVAQSTNSWQPQIYDGSSVITENGKPAVDFDGSNDFLKDSSPVINDTHAIFMVMNGEDGSGTHILDIDGDSDLRFALRDGGQTDYYVREQGSSKELPTIDAAQSKQILTSLVAQGEGNPVETYEDGVQIDSATVPTGNWSTTSMTTRIMTDKKRRGFMKSNQQEMVIYNSDQSSNRSAIESNINNYFNIY